MVLLGSGGGAACVHNMARKGRRQAANKSAAGLYAHELLEDGKDVGPKRLREGRERRHERRLGEVVDECQLEAGVDDWLKPGFGLGRNSGSPRPRVWNGAPLYASESTWREP